MVEETAIGLEDLTPEETGEVKGGGKRFICELGCSEAFSSGILRRNHHAAYHAREYLESTEIGASGRRRNKPRVKKGSAKPEEREREDSVSDDASYTPNIVAGVNMDTVTELTRKFTQAMVDTAPDMSKGKMKQIITAFDNESYSMVSDVNRMTSFLNRCGLTPTQVEFIKLMMMGMDPGQSPNGSPWNTQNNSGYTAMTWDQRTGQMVQTPVFMMGGNNAPATSPGYNAPPMVYMPPNYPTQGAGEGLTKKDLEDVVERLADKLKPPEAPASAGPPMRRYQKAQLDSQGNPVKDANGAYLMGWVEEPISSMGDTLAMLKDIGAIGAKEPPPSVTAVEIAEALSKAVEPLVPVTSGPDPELVDMRDELRESRREFSDFIHRTELKDAETRAADEAVAKTMTAVQPFLDELKEVKSKSGLSEQQLELQHQERLQSNITQTIVAGISGIRTDLQPLVMQSMVASMKGLGIDDNTIGDLLQRMAVKPAAAEAVTTDARRAETLREWAK